MTIKVWLADAEDGEDVARLLLAFRDWFGSERPHAAGMRESVGLLLDDPATEFLLAAVGEDAEPCGVCQLRFRHSVWMSADDCWLEDLYVEAQTRGQGIGRALVEAACERARARGAARIELDTNERNLAAIALYEACGFSSSSKTHGTQSGRDLFFGRRL